LGTLFFVALVSIGDPTLIPFLQVQSSFFLFYLFHAFVVKRGPDFSFLVEIAGESLCWFLQNFFVLPLPPFWLFGEAMKSAEDEYIWDCPPPGFVGHSVLDQPHTPRGDELIETLLHRSPS